MSSAQELIKRETENRIKDKAEELSKRYLIPKDVILIFLRWGSTIAMETVRKYSRGKK